jgi:hypothetical protein
MIITPDTKIGALLDEHPELEETFLSLSPAFAKLRNPLLRKTIGKVATLRQVAQMGDLSLGDLINRLRRETGEAGNYTDSHPKTVIATEAPSWVTGAEAAMTYDARDDLAAGNHPVQRVMQDLSVLDDGKLYILITPFVPIPLIEMASQKGYANWTTEESPGVLKTYFCKA